MLKIYKLMAIKRIHLLIIISNTHFMGREVVERRKERESERRSFLDDQSKKKFQHHDYWNYEKKFFAL